MSLTIRSIANPRLAGGRGDVTDITVVTNADSPYTVLPDDIWIYVDTGDGAVEIDLPAIDSDNPRLLGIKRDGANDVTLDPDGTEQIEGASSLTMGTDGDGRIIIPADGEWRVWASH